MGFGLGALGLAPDAFWRATPSEIAAAARGRLGPAGVTPLRRGELGGLMSRYPDKEPRDG